MHDREKIIKGLEETEIMLSQAVDRGGEMSVMGAFKCLKRVTDILALLQEQEKIVRCKDCLRRGTYDCPVYIGGDGMCSEPDDWYCADGERR